MNKTICEIYNIKEKMPSLEDEGSGLGFLISRPCIAMGKDGCIWTVYWNGENWKHANWSTMIFDKEYIIKWMYIPRFA